MGDYTPRRTDLVFMVAPPSGLRQASFDDDGVHDTQCGACPSRLTIVGKFVQHGVETTKYIFWLSVNSVLHSDRGRFRTMLRTINALDRFVGSFLGRAYLI
jgi:hypothetical protein